MDPRALALSTFLAWRDRRRWHKSALRLPLRPLQRNVVLGRLPQMLSLLRLERLAHPLSDPRVECVDAVAAGLYDRKEPRLVLRQRRFGEARIKLDWLVLGSYRRRRRRPVARKPRPRRRQPDEADVVCATAHLMKDVQLEYAPAHHANREPARQRASQAARGTSARRACAARVRSPEPRKVGGPVHCEQLIAAGEEERQTWERRLDLGLRDAQPVKPRARLAAPLGDETCAPGLQRHPLGVGVV